jgi:ribosomal protein S11
MRLLNFIRSYTTREDFLQRSITNATLKYNTIHVQCTRNNTVACLTDIHDRVVTTTSAGMCGLKNSRKKVAESGYGLEMKGIEHV